jgi:hypothetical protein
MNLPYHDRVVAFVDILGFESLVGRLAEDPKLHEKILTALREIKNYKQIAGNKAFAQKNIEVSVFSDSIAISARREHLFDVLWSCLGLQSRMLVLGVLTRGGVSNGLTVHEDDILYGAGIIKAYRIESRSAIYPRIVIDPQMVGDIPEGAKHMLLTQDNDGMWFIDPFADGLLPPGSEALLEDGWDPNHVALVELGKDIEAELATLNDANHIMKWQWLENYRRVALAYLEAHGKPRIFHHMEKNRTRRHS